MEPCPRCRVALIAGTYRRVPVSRCEACDGVLVEVRHLVPLLNALSGDLIRQIDLDAPIEPHDDAGDDLSCPSCSAAMAHFGYLGTNRVWLDRCGRCLKIWADGAELETLTTLHARTRMRGEERTRWRHEQEDSLGRRTHALLVARAMTSRFVTLM